MSELLALQNKFQAHLLNAQNDIMNEIVNTKKVPTEIRLAIYSYSYRSRLHEALSANYPILSLYLGSEQFNALSHSYINQYPSHYRSIRWFGDQLENFLYGTPPYNNFPYLSELAKIEWTMSLTFDAADSEVICVEKLAAIPPESWVDMCLIAHPSSHLIQLSWNVVPIWQTLSENDTPGELIESEIPISWIFWRKNLINNYCSLSPDEAHALNAMLNGNSFGDICEVLCEYKDESEVAVHAASLLKGWICAGLITEIKY